MKDDEIKAVIQRVAGNMFGTEHILSVEFAESFDENQETIIVVKVIFDNNSWCIDPKKAAEFVRHLKSELGSLGEERFPMVSYVSKTDAGKKRVEAA